MASLVKIILTSCGNFKQGKNGESVVGKKVRTLLG